MKKFPNKVVPKSNESLYSIFYRVAKENHYNHLGSMLKHIAPDIYVTNCNYIDEGHVKTSTLLKVSEMANIEVFEHSLNKYNHLLVHSINFSTKNAANFQSHRVYNKYNTKFCPLCIKEDYYHRLEWDISLVTMCHKHKVKLIDKCPNCHKKFLLNRFMRNECKCGFNFNQIKDYVIEENETILKAQETIHHFLKRNDNQILGLDFSVNDYFFFFFNFCFLIDSNQLKSFPSFNDIGRTKLINFSLKNEEDRNVDMMRVITAIAHMATVEPSKYLSEILRVWEEAKDISLDSYKNDYKYLKTIFNHDKGFYYQSAYDTFLLERKDIYANENGLFKGSIEDKKYITRLEAFKMLKTEWKTLLNLCDYGLLTLHQTKKGDREIHLIEKESVEKYLKMKKECMTLSRLTKYLGVNFQIASGLAERGLIEALHGPKKDGYPIWYFKREEVEHFLGNLISKGTKKINYFDNKWIPFESANLSLRPYKIDTVGLIELLQKGILPFAIIKNEKNIKGICLDAYELDRYIDNKQKELIQRQGFRIKQLQKVFKVGEKKIRKWIDEGILMVTYEEINHCGTISKYISIEETRRVLMEIKGWSDSQTDEYINLFIDN
ncbi:TniQ family protein [Metabacillus litoralis]|uniref:TniQ family protein n=1 Tax=Metabacillus litoralis TaxID=152268 RepID=UPI002041521F|nr:TniQ family protein [Metabacillus litoralis]MCM3412668.1 TniQ family protein [Metabacillus litoralis]